MIVDVDKFTEDSSCFGFLGVHSSILLDEYR